MAGMFRSWFFLIFTLWNLPAWSFPELVRHGYTQCTACHVSPTGGGILTPYGRQLSAEILSTWSKGSENEFLHIKETNAWSEKGWLFGGDIRGLQTRRETPASVTGDLFLMQANLDVAYVKDRVTAMVSIGQIENPLADEVKVNTNSTHYYLLWQVADEWNLRMGRFVPNFGIKVADHIMLTKTTLGLGPQLQLDTFEISFFNENWSLFASISDHLKNIPTAQQEKVGALTIAYNFKERFKVGASHWRGQFEDQTSRSMNSLFGLLGFTEHFYSLLELNHSSRGSTDTQAVMNQWAYEVHKGVVPYLQYQQAQTDLDAPSTLSRQYGLGTHWFPRPHLEFSILWNHIQANSGWSDSAYLLSHYYF